MVDILLAHSYFLKYDAKQLQKMRPYAPLATLYAAAYLRERGYTVALFDAMLADGEHEFELALQQNRPRYVALYEDNFNFLSKMCLSRMREAACRMAAAARAAGAIVIEIADYRRCFPIYNLQSTICDPRYHRAGVARSGGARWCPVYCQTCCRAPP